MLKSKNLFAAAVIFLIMFFFPPQNAAAATDTLKHSLNVKVDLDSRTVSGSDRITLRNESKEVRLFLRSGSEVDKVETAGKEIKYELKDLAQDGVKEIVLTVPSVSNGPSEVTIYFHGKFPSPEEAQSYIKRGVAYVEDGVIGEAGAFLPSSCFWYPQEDGTLTVFDAEVTLPKGYSSVMEGEQGASESNPEGRTERWKEWKLVDGVDLIAGRFHIEKQDFKGITVYTYFLNKDDVLSKKYIEKSKEYLERYQSLIGPYPFKKFAVVESFLPTGYGMPSFTLLGSSVIRLPFIPDTSLGHEIAHNWWGNSVFVDHSLGNWSEAITTYTADYAYERRKGEKEAREFRATKLRGFKNFAAGKDMPLKDFQDATSPVSRAVGYNKGAMVFNMLERLLGKDKFNEGIKRFYSTYAFERASWADIQKSFETVSDTGLGWFFDQWLNRSGGPMLSLGHTVMKKSGKNYQVSFQLKQSDPAYILDLPVLFRTDAGEEWKTVSLNSAKEEFTIELRAKPVSMEADPDFQEFRVLSDEETPPVLAGLLGDKKALVVVPENAKYREKWQGVAELLSKDFGLAVVSDAEAGKTDLLNGPSFIVLGGPGENRLYWQTSQLFADHAKIKADSFEVAGKTYPRKETIFVITTKNPRQQSKMVGIIMTDKDGKAVFETAKRVRYFTDSSYLVFTGDGKVEKGTFEGKKALRKDFK